MEKYICKNVFVPIRSGPTHRSEMLSQVLFGEKYIITDKSGIWLKIETLFDKYSGWIDTDHLQHAVDEDNIPGKVLNRPLVCYKEDKTKLVIEAGCEVYKPDFKNNRFTVGKSNYSTNDEFSKEYLDVKGTLADTAMKFLNSPYLWGGRIPSGMDCSGFIQLVYKIHGIPVKRDSRLQSEEGRAIDFIDETVPGDLVFFDDERGIITHVGMILSKGLVIHESGRVRIDRIDHQGIFKSEINTYSHKLRTIRRIV